MTDIVERLRNRNIPYGANELMDNAADEIEQLRSKAQATEIEQLRAEIDEWSHRAKTAETRLSKQNVEIERLRAERDDWRKRAFAGMPSAD